MVASILDIILFVQANGSVYTGPVRRIDKDYLCSDNLTLTCIYKTAAVTPTSAAWNSCLITMLSIYYTSDTIEGTWMLEDKHMDLHDYKLNLVSLLLSCFQKVFTSTFLPCQRYTYYRSFIALFVRLMVQ